MKSTVVTSIVFGLVLAAALAGMALRPILLHELVGPEEKEVVRLTTGLLTTMSALVLGMLVSSAKSSHDARKTEVVEMSTEVVAIDRLLAGYGPEAGEIRAQFQLLVEASVEHIWPSESALRPDLRPRDPGERLFEQLQLLTASNEKQAATMAQAIPMILRLRQTQWQMFLKTEQSGIPRPLLVVLVSWLAAIFFSFGLFAPPNAIVFVTFVIGALAVSTAIFIIQGMYTPFSGALRISPIPILKALNEMKR